METLSASVQYNDWKGTSAADNLDRGRLVDLLEERGLLNRDYEFLVAIDLFIGENHGGETKPPYISCLIYDKAKFQDVATAIQNEMGPLNLRSVDLDLTIEEFVGLFKRFNVVLTKRGLDLDGRDYNLVGG